MTNGSSDRIDRIERLLERIAENQQVQQEQIKVLVSVSLDHVDRIARQDALIERLDAIIERMVYSEGRNGDDD